MRLRNFVWPLLISLYIILLSVNLLGLPLYLDEGIYLYWSYLFSQDPSYAYVSMQDGKTPLFMWLAALLNQPLNNLLLTARLISVSASAVTLICWLVIGSKILGRKNLIILFILFLISPFNILISRLGFVDSLLSAFGSLSILTVFFIRQTAAKNQIIRTLLLGFLTGLFLGFAFLTKTTAKIFLVAEIILFGFFLFENLRAKKIRPALLTVVSAIIASGVYFEIVNYLRVGAYRFWGQISEKESDLVFTLPEIFNKLFITHDYFTYQKNLPIIGDYFVYYFATLLIFFVIGSFLIIKHRKNSWVLFLVVFLAAGIFLSAKVAASRYFAILIPEFLLVSAIGLTELWHKNKRFLKTLITLALVVPVIFSYKLVFQPLNAYYPPDDRANFVDYNLNALGLNESINFLSPDKEKVAVGVTGIWGVADGAFLSFEERGFETYKLDNFVEIAKIPDEGCVGEFINMNSGCYKINLGKLQESSKDKYIYLNTDKISQSDLHKLLNFEVVKEFERPRTGLKVYLIRLIPHD